MGDLQLKDERRDWMAPRAVSDAEPITDEFSEIKVECPKCGTVLTEYRESCPQCSQPLDEEFCATYRPPTPMAIRIIGLFLLIVLLVFPLVALLWYLLWP